MFGLFRNTYDYHEWSDVCVVSYSREKLDAYYEANNNQADNYPLFSCEESQKNELMGTDKCHYVIKEIEFIE